MRLETLLQKTAWYPPAKRFMVRYSNVCFFAAGFLFDILTIDRIDAWIDLGMQIVYLAAITVLLVYQTKEETGQWTPAGRLARLWHYNTEALHFFYGGLLSAYVIFYNQSASGLHSLIFLFFLVFLMVANEMPQVQRAGHLMRLGLYAFCVVSFLNYLLPVLIGRMGAWVFGLAVAATGGLCWRLVLTLSRIQGDSSRRRWRLSGAPLAVLIAVSLLYAYRWIPPVPLSMPYGGIYHQIEREDGGYRLVYVKPPWYLFWRKDSRRFAARPGDVVHCFVRIFGPRRFRHRIFLQWTYRDERTGRWQLTDRVPLPIVGGRHEGFRGVAAKANFQPGRWEVRVLTEDDRVLGRVPFEIHPDAREGERQWSHRTM